MNGCRRRGERVRRSPLWSIRGREYTSGTDVTDLAFVGARQRHRYEPRNSIPPFGASPTRTLKGNNRNQQVTKRKIWMLALVDREGRQWVSHTDSQISTSLHNPDRYQDSKDGSTETEKRRRDKGRDGSADRCTGSARRGRSSGDGSGGAAESRSVGGG